MGIVDYRTGIVNNVGDLLSVVQAACTDNGWTLTAGNVLHKTDAASGKTCYVRLNTQSTNLQVLGGTGVNGSGVLTGAYVTGSGSGTERFARMGGDIGLSPGVSFPWTYHVHVYDEPDCVFVIINYAGEFFQHLEWGCSNLNIPGNGTWFSGFCGTSTISAVGGVNIGPRGTFTNTTAVNCPWPFGFSSNVLRHTGNIHHGFDGLGWSGTTQGSNSVWVDNEANLHRGIGRMLECQPNAFNSRPIPQPAVIRVRRSDANVSVAAVIPGMRLLRIDTLAPGEVFSYGSEHWKAYPVYRRNSLERDGGGNVPHSGTMGFCLAVDPS